MYLGKISNGPVQFQYLLKSFRALTSFALTAIFTKSSDSLSRCWEELDRLFMNETIFYYDAANIEKQYERFMKFAGPYWMSCVVQDQNCPILEPNHYLKYRI